MSDVQRRRSSGYLEKEWADIDVSTFLPNEDFPERYRERKMKTIHEAIEACDLGRIAELARSSEGLVASDLRVKAWPLLLNVFTANSNSKQKVDSIGASADALDFHDLEPHKDEGQVLLDIKRLFTVMLHFISFSHAVSSSYTTDSSVSLSGFCGNTHVSTIIRGIMILQRLSSSYAMILQPVMMI